MEGFAEVLRGIQAGGEEFEGFGGAAAIGGGEPEDVAAEGDVGAGPLGEGETLAAFPGLEVAVLADVEGVVVALGVG